MSELKIGDVAPDFTLPASNGELVSLSHFRGKALVVYFYPKNNTPACTQEACDFRDFTGAFAEAGANVIGISVDNVKSHEKFKAKYELPFLLLADTEHKVCELFGVWGLKKLYGREYMGLERSTFLLDAKGRLVKAWRKVKVKNHATEVLAAVKEMQQLS